MRRSRVFFLVCIAAAVLTLAACAQPGQTTTSSVTTTTSGPTTAAVTTQQPSGTPQYGGTVRVSTAADITGWDGVKTFMAVPGPTYGITNEPIWWGDWTKGPAGGYGTNDTDWGGHFDIWPLMKGRAAESWSWRVEADGSGTIVYNVRQGVHYGLNPNSAASKLVAGREMTADDVLFNLQRVAQDPDSYVAKSNPELKTATFTKTDPWQVTIKLAKDAMVTAIARLGMYGRVEPPEVIKQYGNMADWRNQVGTGPFMLTDYVGGSVAVLKKNNNYWDVDPIGPGKGNRVPYLDEIRLLIIPDPSTRDSAMRTGKLDWNTYAGEAWEQAATVVKSAPQIKQAEGTIPHGGEIQLRTDRPPLNNVKVRQALMMATDFETIKKNVNGGVGQIQTWPFPKVKGYEDLYVDNNDPDVPQIVRDLYAYNPDKAKQFLKDAGYPSGFQMTALVSSAFATDVDFYTILVDQWSKVNVKLVLDIKENAAVTGIQRAHQQPEATIWGGSPVAIFYAPATLYGTGANMSELKDQVILDALQQMRGDAIQDLRLAMKDMRQLSIYLREQAYHIPRPKRAPINLWWPWLKNYSGESWVSYGTWWSWSQWVWVDQNLKKDLGY